MFHLIRVAVVQMDGLSIMFFREYPTHVPPDRVAVVQMDGLSIMFFREPCWPCISFATAAFPGKYSCLLILIFAPCLLTPWIYLHGLTVTCPILCARGVQQVPNASGSYQRLHFSCDLLPDGLPFTLRAFILQSCIM